MSFYNDRMYLQIINISEADATAAKYELLNHPEPNFLKKNAVLHLKYQGHSNKEVADVLEVSSNTVGDYLIIYEARNQRW